MTRTFLTLGPAGMALEWEPLLEGIDAVAATAKSFAQTLAEVVDHMAKRDGPKRPGQWTDRTRAKRARRLEKARQRRAR